MLTQVGGFLQVQAAEHLGRHDPHLSIRLDQQAAVAGQGIEGLLPLPFGVGTHRRRPLGHQVVAPFHQPGAPRCGVALPKRLEFTHHGIEEADAVIKQQPQTAPFGPQVIGFLAQAFLFQAREPPQWHGQHGIGLAFAEFEPDLECCLCGGRIGGGRDHGDHLLQMGQGRDQALHHLQAVLAALERVAGAPQQGEFAVFEELLQ